MAGILRGLQVVNPWLDTTERRKQVLTILAPVITVAIVIFVIGAVSLHNYRITRNGAIKLTNDLLSAQQSYIVREVADYLVPATEGSPLAATMITRATSLDDQRHSFMLFSRSLLTHAPQTESFYLADEDGHFWINVKADNNFIETTLEPGTPANKSVFLVHNTIDKDGKLIATNKAAVDAFDPREMDWYKGAFRSRAHHPDQLQPIHWTAPYWDPDTKQYILTASLAFNSSSGKKMVFAANISLSRITDFINSLKVGKTGQAVIVDLHGRVIAGHNMLSLGQPDFDPTNVFLNPVTQPVFTRALNIYRVKGAGSEIVRSRKKDYVTISSGIPLAKRNWVLMLNAPEKDFADFTQVAHRQTLVLSLIIIGLAVLLASGLVWQGVRLRQIHMRVVRDEDDVKSESTSLAAISQMPGILDPHKEVDDLTEILATRTNAGHVGIWKLADANTMICEDIYDTARKVHGAGMRISQSTNTSMFNALKSGRPTEIDLTSHPKDREELKAIYSGIKVSKLPKQLYIYPIVDKNQIIGAITVEDAKTLADGKLAIAFVGSILVLRFQGAMVKKTKAVVPKEKRIETRHIDGFLLTPEITNKQAFNGKWPTPGLYPEIPLMILEFSSDFSSNPEKAKLNLKIIQELSIKIQDICKKEGVYSLQVSGSRVVFLGECRLENNIDGVQRLAEAALHIREQCLLALSKLDSNLTFNIGIDVGPALVGILGKDPQLFNLWGEVFSIATLLAESTPDGGMIQVSETAFRCLKDSYFFRPRGEFFLPGVGTSACYILAGRS